MAKKKKTGNEGGAANAPQGASNVAAPSPPEHPSKSSGTKEVASPSQQQPPPPNDPKASQQQQQQQQQQQAGNNNESSPMSSPMSAAAKKNKRKKKTASTLAEPAPPANPFEGMTASQKKNAKRRLAGKKEGEGDDVINTNTSASAAEVGDPTFDPLDQRKREIIEDITSRLAALCPSSANTGEENYGINQIAGQKNHLLTLANYIDEKLALCEKPKKPTRNQSKASVLAAQLESAKSQSYASNEDKNSNIEWIQHDFEEAREYEAARKFTQVLTDLKRETLSRTIQQTAKVEKAKTSNKTSETTRRLCAMHGIDIRTVSDNVKVKNQTIDVPTEVATALNNNTTIARAIEKKLKAVIQRPQERRQHCVLLASFEDSWKDAATELHKIDFSGLHTISVDPNVIGAIIGQGGSTAQKIEEDYGVYIRADKTIITLYGSKEDVEKATSHIGELLNDAQTSETFIIPLPSALGLMAQSGQQAKAIEKKTNTTIQVQGRGPPKGTPPTYPVIVKGKAEDIINAKKEITDFMAKLNSATIEVPSDVAPLLFPPRQDAPKQQEGQSPSSQQKNPSPVDRPLQEAFRRLTTSSKASVQRVGTTVVITGAKQDCEAARKEVESIFRKAQQPVETLEILYEQGRIINLDKRKAIEVSAGVSMSLQGTTLSIRGDSKGVAAAKAEIQQLLNSRSETKTIELGSVIMNKMIRERKVQAMEKATSTSISFDKKEGTAKIVGSAETIAEAEKQLLALQQQEEQNEKDATKKDIPCSTPAIVIGPKGSVINKIRQASGAELIVNDEKKTIELIGTPEAVKMAEDMVNEILGNDKDKDTEGGNNTKEKKQAASPTAKEGGASSPSKTNTKDTTTTTNDNNTDKENKKPQAPKKQKKTAPTHKVNCSDDFPSLATPAAKDTLEEGNPYSKEQEANGDVPSAAATQPTDDAAVIQEPEEETANGEANGTANTDAIQNNQQEEINVQ